MHAKGEEEKGVVIGGKVEEERNGEWNGRWVFRLRSMRNSGLGDGAWRKGRQAVGQGEGGGGAGKGRWRKDDKYNGAGAVRGREPEWAMAATVGRAR